MKSFESIAINPFIKPNPYKLVNNFLAEDDTRSRANSYAI